MSAPETKEERAARIACEEHGYAARYYWTKAYSAMRESRFEVMRTNAALALDAETLAAPPAYLHAVLFGAKPVRAWALERGFEVPKDVAADARAHVIKALIEHETKKRGPAFVSKLAGNLNSKQ